MPLWTPIDRRSGVVGNARDQPTSQGGLACISGAMAILQMWDHFEFQHFLTGFQSENGPSEAAYRKMALSPDGTSVVTLVDPAAMPGGKLTT